MLNRILFLFIVMMNLFILPGCFEKEQASSLPKVDGILINLDDSTNIILELIRNKQLSKALDNPAMSQEQLDILIKNTSPAQMAIQAELLQYNEPSVLLLYRQKTAQFDSLLANLQQLAVDPLFSVRIALVPVATLTSLADMAQFDVDPTILVLYDREQTARFEGGEIFADGFMEQLRLAIRRDNV